MYQTKLSGAVHSNAIVDLQDDSALEDAKLCVINEEVLPQQKELLTKIKRVLNTRIADSSIPNGQIATEMDRLKQFYQELSHSLQRSEQHPGMAQDILDIHRSCVAKMRALNAQFSQAEDITDIDELFSN